MRTRRTFIQQELASLWRRRRDRKVKSYLFSRSPLATARRENLQIVLGELGSLVRLNMPLVEGLERLLLDAPVGRVFRVLVSLRNSLLAGSSLWESMQKQPRFFPRHCVEVIKMGEQTGTLLTSFQLLDSEFADLRPVYSAMRAWQAYAWLVGVGGLGPIVFNIIYVLPVFVEIMRDFGGAVPASFRFFNRFLEAIGSVIPFLPLVLLPLAVFMVYYGLQSHANPLRKTIRSLALRIADFLPFVRGYVRSGSLGVVGFSLATLTKARIPLNEALVECADMGIHPSIAASLLKARTSVEQGSSLTDALRKAKSFPESFVLLVSLGEQSGLLPEALNKVGWMYRQKAISCAQTASDILWPITAIALGSVVLLLSLVLFQMNVGFIDGLVSTM